PGVAGLCLDTGHLYYAGMDPAATLRQYASRLDYLHFKDIDPLVFDHYRQMVRIAEAAKFDAVFVADSLAAAGGPVASRMARSSLFEPLTLLSALAVVSERIGLIATMTTSYNEPYH
ncbi:LLM class flavin-dependent oxidoreductase, partial [Pseudomonas viridiflava]|uniref:LLM class flavin-dependent oxidoreductase n=1 Tax=Pseudomonas viridiflava TaxID=33069 RepID=UPI00292A5D3C